MLVIRSSTLPTGSLEGHEHGATVSLILDESEPGHGPRLHGSPHKFVNAGPGRSKLVCIHANPTIVTEWLE
jgi:hypothetical protein